MNEVIGYINILIKNYEQKLGKGKNDILKKKIELTYLLKLLKDINKLKIPLEDYSDIKRIPENATDFSEYRVIDDCDTDLRDLWIENKLIQISEGDLVIKFK